MKADTRNPLVKMRRNLGLTQVQLAERTGLSRQIIIRTEQAQFPVPSQVLLDYFYEQSQYMDEEAVILNYVEFQKVIRAQNGVDSINPVLLPTFPTRAYLALFDATPIHPFKFWRTNSNPPVTVVHVAKCLCVHQGMLYKYEDEPHLVNTTPGQLVEALTDAGYPDSTLRDLQLCYNEFKEYHHQLALLPLGDLIKE